MGSSGSASASGGASFFWVARVSVFRVVQILMRYPSCSDWVHPLTTATATPLTNNSNPSTTNDARNTGNSSESSGSSKTGSIPVSPVREVRKGRTVDVPPNNENDNVSTSVSRSRKDSSAVTSKDNSTTFRESRKISIFLRLLLDPRCRIFALDVLYSLLHICSQVLYLDERINADTAEVTSRSGSADSGQEEGLPAESDAAANHERVGVDILRGLLKMVGAYWTFPLRRDFSRGSVTGSGAVGMKVKSDKGGSSTNGDFTADGSADKGRGSNHKKASGSIAADKTGTGGSVWTNLLNTIEGDYSVPFYIHEGEVCDSIGAACMSLQVRLISSLCCYSVPMMMVVVVLVVMMMMMSILTSAISASRCFYLYTPHLPSPCLPYLTIPLF